jgi:adenylate cyclase
MFLDINSSTTIAERLGNTKYHDLLKEFFADVTSPIIENKGEIYQYVGDEIVVTWASGDQVQYWNCIKCFFEIKLHIERHREKYLSNYGLVPSFKAGIHYGKVTVGEIGIIKRDITCSGMYSIPPHGFYQCAMNWIKNWWFPVNWYQRFML